MNLFICGVFLGAVIMSIIYEIQLGAEKNQLDQKHEKDLLLKRKLSKLLSDRAYHQAALSLMGRPEGLFYGPQTIENPNHENTASVKIEITDHDYGLFGIDYSSDLFNVKERQKRLEKALKKERETPWEHE